MSVKFLSTTLLGVCLFSIQLNTLSQKAVLDHTAYNDWKSIKSSELSGDGEFVAYESKPYRGDGTLYLYSSQGTAIDSFARGQNPSFSWKSDVLFFKVQPHFDSLRKLELYKVDKKKWPKDTIYIYSLTDRKVIKSFPNNKQWEVSKETSWAYFLSNEDLTPKTEQPTKKKCRLVKKKQKSTAAKEKEVKSKGTTLVIFNGATQEECVIHNVHSANWSEKGSKVLYVTELNGKHQLHVFSTSTQINQELTDTTYTSFKNFSWNKTDETTAFLASSDTNEVKQYQLFTFNFSDNTLNFITDSTTAFPSGKTVSEHATPQFFQANYLLIGVADAPVQPAKDTLTESEKYKLDIWHYQDPQPQPMQLIRKNRDEKKSWLMAYDLTRNYWVSISNDTLSVINPTKNQSTRVFLENDFPYAIADQWESNGMHDLYATDIQTGKITLIKKGLTYQRYISPNGDQVIYFDHNKGAYKLLNVGGEESCITCGKNAVWTEDINGMPMEAQGTGVLGWMNDGSILLQSRHNLFVFANNTLEPLTKFAEGKKENTLQITLLDRDSAYLELDRMVLKQFDFKTKNDRLYFWNGNGFELTHSSNGSYVSTTQARENKDAWLFREETVKTYPELQITLDGFKTSSIISSTNPQQSQYNWTSVDLIDWKTYSGDSLQGLVYTPENYDPTKKYPLLVYFYELYSHEKNRYYSPKPTASIIYPTEYASAGYIVFIPDVRYRVGHPAQSAFDCIVSGTDAVANKYAVDTTRMGLQGQSWGGYQTAQLITMTKKYAAAMAGAPVSNMFSAYGGTRWGSGMNRQFQYEKTQSRIGQTIWEAPELYIENSPLFHLPKVETPLLIMHNDEDGAVPWYQGIELYNGLRRLEKPVWMLNYNGDDHNLMKEANRMDLSIRMRQFFDHYLQNKPAPVWLVNGIPAVKKGKMTGYELIEE